jgi:hypothetical protein
MAKDELRGILINTTTAQRNALESIIINGNQAKYYGANLTRLERLGLINYRNREEGYAYCGGPISEFFEVMETLV